MKPIIKADKLGKQYLFGAETAAYSTVREAVMDILKSPLSSIRRNGSAPTIWALQDVSFEVQPGEIVGIIGRNGAGKSTLLKILSRITEPTTGRVELYGRVASLLEVGTGFHPELTGRENIFLNGSILGMTLKEIESKFDEIVAFAEVEKFIDTPVKRYSSGMYVRLAFAVAAFLEPEILVVDEVLAVGDAAFQKKCLGRMRDVAGRGRTVLFVSHNMAAVASLCSRAIVLEHGSVVFLGQVDEAIKRYLSEISELTRTQLMERVDRKGEGKIRITDFKVFDGLGDEQEIVSLGESIELRIYYRCKDNETPRNVAAGIAVLSQTGSFVTMLSNLSASDVFETIPQEGYIACKIARLPLAPGDYTLNLILRQNDIVQDWIQEAVVLTVQGGDFYATGRAPHWFQGSVFVDHDWSTSR